MRAIPTKYKGISFRSRLEASWAAYFDHLDISWAYEVEGYRLPSGESYLPDFYIRQNDWRYKELFVECKAPSSESILKAGQFASSTNNALLIAMPEGRFAFVTHKNTKYICEENWDYIEYISKKISSLGITERDAVGGRYAYFWNGGDASDAYTGSSPEYFDTMKDKNRPDGGDARTYYYGGWSTWGQRGFDPPRWKRK